MGQCICCTAGERAITTHRPDVSGPSFTPGEMGEGRSEPRGGPPVVGHWCRVCGYRWQKLRYPGPKGTVVVHDFPSRIPGQPPRPSGPESMLARQAPHGTDEADSEGSGASSSPPGRISSNNYFRITPDTDGFTRAQITRERFERQLRRRQQARRGAVCN